MIVLLKEGKLPIYYLKKLIKFVGFEDKDSIIIPPSIGYDATAINVSKGEKICKDYYEVEENCLLIVKSDPITFETSNPGKFSVIVNANDVTCLGGVPYGVTVTLLIPEAKNSFTDVQFIQEQISQICKKLQIRILGGHTEISSAVIRPVISLSMLGFVPQSFLVSGLITPGDLIFLIGYIGNEGTSILAQELNDRSPDVHFSTSEIQIFENSLYIGEIALRISKYIKPIKLHDPTEGGLLGALFEIFQSVKTSLGASISKKTLFKHIHPITAQISSMMDLNPLRLISSGTLIAIIRPHQREALLNIDSSLNLPVSMIGTVRGSKLIFEEDKSEIKESTDELVSDEIVKAYKYLERKFN